MLRAFSGEAVGAFHIHVSRYKYSEQFQDIDSLLVRLRDVLLRGTYVLSQEVSCFESAFANYCGCLYSRGVNSGTDALIISLKALGIQPGDEVITQANTFHATVAAIVIAGAKPVLVDANEDDFLMDTRQLAGVITEKTRAIIPVHLYGKPTPMQDILDVARSRGLFVIEDAAQAHGASVGIKRVGSFGDCGCFSFHPSKNLAAAGDAGAIVTSDRLLAERIDLHRSLGQVAQNEHSLIGLNSKLDGIQACVLHDKLSQLDSWNNSRSLVASWYRQQLESWPVMFQSLTPGTVHAYHLLPVRTMLRDDMQRYLKAEGVDAVVRYPTPIHLQPAFERYGWRSGQFPVAESLSRELLCLPIRPGMEMSEVSYVTGKIKSFWGRNAEAV